MRTYWTARLLAALLLLTLIAGCVQAPEEAPKPTPRPQVVWLDDNTVAWTSGAGIQMLSLPNNRRTTHAGSYQLIAPSPDGSRIAYWGAEGIGITMKDPRSLWSAADIGVWAAERLGAGAEVTVDEIYWSLDGRQAAFLLRAHTPAGGTVTAIAAYDAVRGDRIELLVRTAAEGLIKTFRWHGDLLVQFGNPDGTSEVVLTWLREKGMGKPMARLPAGLNLADLRGSVALFTGDGSTPPQTARLQVGLQFQPVGKPGESGLLSPRDGQFVPLGPDRRGAAISPGGRSLAIPAAQNDGTWGVRIERLPEPGIGLMDPEQAQPLVIHSSPAPGGDGPPPDLTDIWFRTEQEGFGLRPGGAVVQTRDGGSTWKEVFRAADANLVRIYFAGEASFVTGWWADGRPLLIRSTDGGRTWEAVKAQGAGPAGYAPHRTFAFVSAEVGYAVLDADTWGPPGEVGDLKKQVLATRDGGRTWEALSLPDEAFTTGGLHFISPEQGFITAVQKGKYLILGTADGGRSWQTLHTSEIPLYSVQFVDHKHGFAGGGIHYKAERPPRQYLLATRDGGATWEEVYRSGEREGGNISQMRFISPTTGWAGLGVCSMGQNGPCPKSLIFTSDGGRTWRRTGVSALRWSTVGARAWALDGRSGENHMVISRTENGGATWERLWHRAALAVSRVQFLDPQTGWIWTNAGLFRTTDGGRTWKPYRVGSPVAPDFWPHFTGPLTAVAVADYKLQRSQDGGRTWEQLELPKNASISRMVFADDRHGWLSTYSDGLWATQDGGRTWQKPSPGLSESVNALAFADGQRGVAATYRHLLFTRDGGANWTGQPLKDVSFYWASYTADGHVWLAGSRSLPEFRTEGILAHSPDEGRTWLVYRTPVYVQGLHFVSGKDGWLMGQWEGRSVLVQTRDDGLSWQQVWLDLH